MSDKDLYNAILNTAGKAIVDEMKKLMIKPVRRKSGGQSYPMKKGALYNSIKHTVKNNVLDILSNDYAEYVDKGRFSGGKKVPIQALVKWIKNNNIRPRNNKTGRFTTVIGMAFAIQTNIFKYGITERNFIKPAMKMGEALVDELIDINFGNKIDEILEQIALEN
jgi:hypothetical protein